MQRQPAALLRVQPSLNSSAQPALSPPHPQQAALSAQLAAVVQPRAPPRQRHALRLTNPTLAKQRARLFHLNITQRRLQQTCSTGLFAQMASTIARERPVLLAQQDKSASVVPRLLHVHRLRSTMVQETSQQLPSFRY
jgi:hypothetical protein